MKRKRPFGGLPDILLGLLVIAAIALLPIVGLFMHRLVTFLIYFIPSLTLYR